VNFLVDECLRPLVAAGVRNAGHDAIHVGDVGLLGATDEQVMSLEVEQSRILVSADTNFGELLARDRLSLPSCGEIVTPTIKSERFSTISAMSPTIHSLVP